MSAIDSRVAAVLDHRDAADSDDEDALIAELEDDDSAAASALREKRLEQLHAEVARAKRMKQDAFGTYVEIKDEKDVLDLTTRTKLCVVHFMKPDFARCAIMDQKLAVLAAKHFDTRFVSVNVVNAPWLVVKLGIQVLPCVIPFIDGVSQDRILGFEGLGRGKDDFKPQDLEARLLASGVLVRKKMTAEDGRREPSLSNKAGRNEQDDGDDWD